MIVKEQKPIEFVNTCNAKFDARHLEQAILLKTNKPVQRLKRVFMHGKYPAISIHGMKYHIHRLLTEYWSGDITGFYVDHINGDKLDATLPNLRILEPAVHQSITNKGRRQTPQHVYRRIASTVKTRYGKVYENKELLNGA